MPMAAPSCNMRLAALNIIDISPLHTVFVKKHKKLNDEIRLAKQFCRAQDCYGAESYINGFSGYSCELLVIHYGSFKKLARKAAKWKPKVVIDILKKYKGKNPLEELNPSKTQSPLVIIDPVFSIFTIGRRALVQIYKYKKFTLFFQTKQINKGLPGYCPKGIGVFHCNYNNFVKFKFLPVHHRCIKGRE